MVRIGIKREPKFRLVRMRKNEKDSNQPERKGTVSAGWTIYDPVLRGFVLKPKCEKPIWEWLERKDPFSYWLAVCITNDTEKPILSFELRFKMSGGLRVLEAYVEGYDKPIEVGRDGDWWVVRVYETYGLSVPRGGSKRLFVKIHSDVCGQVFTVESGVVKANGIVVRLSDITFRYACDIENVKEDLVAIKEAETLINALTSKLQLKLQLKMLSELMDNIVYKRERSVRWYLSWLESFERECSNREFYERVEKCFKDVGVIIPEWERAENRVTAFDVEFEEEDLKRIGRCLILAMRDFV